MIDSIYNTGLQLSSAPWWTGAGWPVVWGLVKIVCVVVPLLVAVAYMTLWERKAATSRNPRLTPCPASGCTTCAASPSSSSRPCA